ncbi:MAG: hypothetical protein K9M36_03075 [Candidatus Pacebacteria bacterium]|nr:hypothetical protein [Candidatus Paceibacterota bacterium]
MTGIDIYEIASFIRQVGLALAGGMSLWGFVFLLVARFRTVDREKKETLEWAGHRLFFGSLIACVLAGVGWLVLWSTWPALAHEGITLFPTGEEYAKAFYMTIPWNIVWIFFSAVSLVLYGWYKNIFEKMLPWILLFQFLLVSFLISVYAWTGSLFSAEQIFFYFHGFHSIFTVGTVLTLDFLVLSTRRSIVKQLYLFPFFPSISKIIFIGLGLDFLSVALVFGQALEFSTRFFVAQTVVSILIINGVFLAGPLTRKILAEIRSGNFLSGRWKTYAMISGSISIVSWVTITFIDYVPRLQAPYVVIMSCYVVLIFCGILINKIVDYYDKRFFEQK